MPKSEMNQFLTKLAEEIREAADQWKRDAAEHYTTNSPCDREMRKVAAADAREIRKVSTMVRSGQILSAYDRASSLDTIVREAIPDKFWEFSGKLSRVRG
jgi:hypothetical protein